MTQIRPSVPPEDLASVEGQAEPTAGRQRLRLGMLREPMVGGSVAVIALITLAALLIPPFLPYGPNDLVSDTPLGAPSAQHPLGTDELGRDLLARVLGGVRASLLVIVVSVPIALVVGGLLGLFATSSRWTDTPVQRVFDIVLAFPGLVMGLAVAAILGAGLTAVIVTAAISAIPVFGRVIRGAVRSQAARGYVLSERVLGVGKVRLYLRHILPNCFDVVLVQTALACSTAVFLEGGLSFLGLGVNPPDPSLGSLLQASLTFLQAAPFYAIGPLVMISLLVLCFTVLADALNRSLARR